MTFWEYRPYVPVAQRRANAVRAARKLAKGGRKAAPVSVAGRTIASTFWGKAWCDNLESYSDFSNRLPRGRAYARNGSVVDLQIEPGKITGLVSGSDLYRVSIGIKPLVAARWKDVKAQCRGQIGSLIELLQGRLSQQVMEVVTRHKCGLFPSPSEIEMDCSCPDWAEMCKHVAAVLYGVGNRLDHQPDLLFRLRQVDHLELVTDATEPAAPVKKPTGKKVIAASDLAQVFGIELETSIPARKPYPRPAVRKAHPAVEPKWHASTKEFTGKPPSAKPAAPAPRKQIKEKATKQAPSKSNAAKER